MRRPRPSIGTWSARATTSRAAAAPRAGSRALGANALYPALLSGYAVAEADGGKERLRSLASALTTMFARYNVIAGRETTVMESTVYEAAANLRKTKDFDAAVAALAALAPDADDFVTGFQRATVSRIATARYLLREIEHAKRRTQELSVEGTDCVHVEHIYPQAPDGAKRRTTRDDQPARELDVAG